MNHRIEQTKKYLWEKLMESECYKSHPADGEYRYEHSIRVANIGKTIAHFGDTLWFPASCPIPCILETWK